MIYKRLLSSFCFILISLFVNAQSPAVTTKLPPDKLLEKKIAGLTQQNTLLKTRLQQSTLDNQRLQTQILSLQQTIQRRNDSIAQQQATIDGLRAKMSQLTAQNNQLQNDLSQRTTELATARNRITQLEYDRKVLTDNRIIRIYNFSADDVRKQFIRNLSAPESGFQYDDDLIDDEIQITRNFGDQAEAWWVFDKTLDTILELKIRIKPHLYDPQKALVFGETKLLQKTRYSNKPFDEQHDREKINLYREKTLRMLEGKLSGTSEK
ncbi:coiled-coil domain-containing protein [Spirosoma aerolatum]|uniref:hypothetical protein n=1 Tax=Spirosoma aerolatum TaxID=1211326 RepID=UPI0009ABC2A2|nr:hypothetical protein [Spirosoma aerolatum]